MKVLIGPGLHAAPGKLQDLVSGVYGLGLVHAAPGGADATLGRLEDWRQRPVQLTTARPTGREWLPMDDLVPVGRRVLDLLE